MNPSDLPSPAVRRAARAVLLLGALASIALLGAALRRFDASITRGPVLWYLSFAATSGILFWCAVRLRPAAQIALSVVGVSTVLLLYGADVALELTARAQKSQIQRVMAARTGKPFDRRSVSEMVWALRNSGTRAVPSVVPKAILEQWGPEANPATAWTSPLLPLAGISKRPTVQLCNEGGFQVYESDERGFDNALSAWSQGAHDIALIGDSFTHGYCVDADHSYAGLIHKRWPSSLNLGTGGNGPLAELATLTEYAAPLRPPVVVWQFFFNDMTELQTERRNTLLLRYLEPTFSQELTTRQPEIDQAIEPWVDRMYAAGREVDWLDRFHWRQILTLYRLRELVRVVTSGAGEPEDPFPQLQLFQSVLQVARDRVSGWGGRLYFVFVPEWERYYQPAVLEGRDVRDSVLRIARELDLPVIDFEAVVRQHPNRVELFAHQELAKGHFTALGYELMAREVGRVIEKDPALAGSAR